MSTSFEVDSGDESYVSSATSSHETAAAEDSPSDIIPMINVLQYTTFVRLKKVVDNLSKVLQL